MRRLKGMTDEYRDLGVLNFEMEAATLFKMGLVYGFAAGCVCAIIAQRTEREEPDLSRKDAAVDAAIRVAVRGRRPLGRPCRPPPVRRRRRSRPEPRSADARGSSLAEPRRRTVRVGAAFHLGLVEGAGQHLAHRAGRAVAVERGSPGRRARTAAGGSARTA